MFEYLLTESKSGVKTLCAKDIETNRKLEFTPPETLLKRQRELFTPLLQVEPPCYSIRSWAWISC